MPTSGQVVPLFAHERDDGPDILVVDDNPANLVAIEAALADLARGWCGRRPGTRRCGCCWSTTSP